MEHDASYKLLFSHARMVEDLLPARLPGVEDRETLHTLLRQAITCPTLAAFRGGAVPTGVEPARRPLCVPERGVGCRVLTVRLPMTAHADR